MDQAAIIAKKDQIIAKLSADNSLLRAELSELKRLIFGQKSERFIADHSSSQMSLELGLVDAAQQAVQTEKVSYERKAALKKKNENHPGRNPLPDHLRREIKIIEPDVDTEDLVKIGEEVTETLQLKAAEFFVLREVRPKYLEKKVDSQGQEQSIIHIAPQPERPLPKTIAGISLLVQILISKYQDHLPLYRQSKIFARDEVTIARSTLSDWVAAVCDLLDPLYQVLKKEVLKQIYLMADESRMQVLDSSKKGKSHRGFMWVYYAPLIQSVFFDYQKGRGKKHALEMLKDYEGYLQVDGYRIYELLFDQKEQVSLLSCMAHARRYFDKALQNDKERASQGLTLIQELYNIEREAKEQKLTHPQRKQLRQQKALPILDTLKSWALEEYPKVLPKSAIGKALQYYLQREEKLRRYTLDGRLEIDNNYVENSIRPLALGRKNYLFCGSHNGAQRAALIYSFFGSCEKMGINSKDWLEDVLERIAQHPVNKLGQLLPRNWEKQGNQ